MPRPARALVWAARMGGGRPRRRRGCAWSTRRQTRHRARLPRRCRCSGRRLASGRLPRGAQDGSRARFRLDKPSMPEPCGSSAARRPPNLARHRRDRQRREGGYQQHGDGLRGPQPSTPPNPDPVRLHRQLLRPLDPDRQQHRDRPAAGRHGWADRLLPPHLRRAPRLG
jgi:hypothetical protein